MRLPLLLNQSLFQLCNALKAQTRGGRRSRENVEQGADSQLAGICVNYSVGSRVRES